MSSVSIGTRLACASTACSIPLAQRAATPGRTFGHANDPAHLSLPTAAHPPRCRPSNIQSWLSDGRTLVRHPFRLASLPSVSSVRFAPQLVLSAEPTDMELEVAKLRALFEANRNSKLERWEIEKGVQREGLSLEALQMPPALMGEFVIGEVEGEPGWTLEKFLEWFQIQRDRLAAAEADEAAQAERAEAEEAKRRARKTQEAALLSRLSLYDANSDAEEEEEALSRNRVAEVSQWAAKDVRAASRHSTRPQEPCILTAEHEPHQKSQADSVCAPCPRAGCGLGGERGWLAAVSDLLRS